MYYPLSKHTVSFKNEQAHFNSNTSMIKKNKKHLCSMRHNLRIHMAC